MAEKFSSGAATIVNTTTRRRGGLYPRSGMPDATRLIGLSLGADLCWPIFYEDILAALSPTVRIGGETVRFEVERVTIEPFDLAQPVRYDVLLDRLTPWYHTSREWIKKAIVQNDLYVLNNTFTLQSMEKHTSYAAMIRLGLPVPKTLLLPPKEYDELPDLQMTLASYARMFDLAELGERVGYPAYLKPYDGGAWRGVSRVENAEQLQAAYDASGRQIMHLQESIEPYDLFVRALAVGPQVNVIKYDPSAPIHDRYQVEFGFVDADEQSVLEDTVLTINSFFGWDFNSCESLRRNGTFHPIDFANANPDSQVTSLHYHIPWLVKALLRWSLYCAATRRRMRHHVDWTPFFLVAEDPDLDPRQKLAAYAEIAAERYETERFEEFCARHLADLDEVTWEYFASDRAREAVRRKVAVLFPAHEVDSFTDHFWGLIQFWRKTERDRLDGLTGS